MTYFLIHTVATPATDLTGILQREAVYCAIGRTSTRMKQDIPFDEWLSSTLLPEAQETNPQYPIIKRRIAWLVGKWVGSDSTSPNNPKVWQLLVGLLQDHGPGTDGVVRLTAAVALKECLDVSSPARVLNLGELIVYLRLAQTTSFNPDVFLPYLPTAVAELVRLRSDADTMEIKRRVCTTLNVLIERMDTRIVPFMDIITAPLPQLCMRTFLHASGHMLTKSLQGRMQTTTGCSKECCSNP